MKKKIAVALCLVLVLLMLASCGTDSADVDYNGYSYEELKEQAKINCSYAQQLSELFGEYGITEEDFTTANREQFLSSNDLTEAQLDAAFRWLELTDEVGEFVEMDEESFSIEKAGDTLTANLKLVFEERDVDFQVVYTYYNMELSGITIEPVYTLSEKLEKAGLNTLISILIVFAVLILISLLIACFRIFPYLEKKKAEGNARTEEEPAVSAASAVPVWEPVRQTDDTELAAVIAAAIAAAEGTAAGDFVVRSINRRK